jgi:hypothetical protein
MNPIVFYLVEVVVTLLICLSLIKYLNPFLKRILVDLCATEDRAQFWAVFTNILLVGLPLVIALAYRPEANDIESMFFELTSKLSANLIGFLFALVGVGLMISIFALFAPRPAKVESK